MNGHSVKWLRFALLNILSYIVLTAIYFFSFASGGVKGMGNSALAFFFIAFPVALFAIWAVSGWLSIKLLHSNYFALLINVVMTGLLASSLTSLLAGDWVMSCIGALIAGLVTGTSAFIYSSLKKEKTK